MFRHGSVHCDPHGANVLVRPHPAARKGSGAPQLVLLDHGLYRELTEQFRVDHCRLWKAMVFKDIPGGARREREGGRDGFEKWRRGSSSFFRRFAFGFAAVRSSPPVDSTTILDGWSWGAWDVYTSFSYRIPRQCGPLPDEGFQDVVRQPRAPGG